MIMYKVRGGCHCGNILVDLELSRAPGTYNPRVCDCDFCRKHGASYLSDPDGSLHIHVKDAHFLGKYRQGSGIADCLLCSNCGVLVGVAYQNDGQLFAAVNSQVVEEGTSFGEKKVVSPKTLTAREKTERWKGIWFPNVTLIFNNA